MANSADTDQTPRFAASDMGRHCLLRSVDFSEYLGGVWYKIYHVTDCRDIHCMCKISSLLNVWDLCNKKVRGFRYIFLIICIGVCKFRF